MTVHAAGPGVVPWGNDTFEASNIESVNYAYGMSAIGVIDSWVVWVKLRDPSKDPWGRKLVNLGGTRWDDPDGQARCREIAEEFTVAWRAAERSDSAVAEARNLAEEMRKQLSADWHYVSLDECILLNPFPWDERKPDATTD